MKNLPLIGSGFLAVVLLLLPKLTASEMPVPVQEKPAPASSPASTAAKEPVKSAETSTTRLQTMKAALESALANLEKARTNPEGKFFEEPIADLKYGLENVAKGLDYVKAHPESDTLITRPVRAGWPVLVIKNGGGLGTLRNNANFSALREGDSALGNGLRQFLIGDSTTGYLVMNEIGGYRDKILRGVDTADAKIVKWAIDYSRRGNPRYAGQIQPASAPTHAPADQAGSISGKVLDANGNPAAFAAISIHLRSEIEANGSAITRNPSRYATVSFPGGVIATIADATGAFTISDLAPDSYVVTAIITNGAQQQTVTHPPVEVKAGAETKIAEPLTMFHLNRGLGG